MIVLDRVYKSLGMAPHARVVFQGLSATIPSRGGVAILGHRGSGRSTLISLINRALRPDRGRVDHALRISWTLGSANSLMKNQSLHGNIRSLATLYGRYPPTVIEAVLEMTGIRSAYAAKPLREVPLEIRHRGAFALCLALQFDCYVADEVLMLGDASFREHAGRLVEQVVEERGLILATRNLALVRRFCRMGFILHGGKLTQFDSVGDLIRAYKQHTTES